jgi:hypothetical protein
MTKVQTAYKLSRTLGDEDLESLSKLPSVYGIFFAKLAPSLDSMLIEYDASRLTHDQLDAILETRGLPITRAA